ncbi:cryptochrome/photolyase family protein [Salipaludibacillus daqingensis]|uniref:cryptochrome/photolyase family protein n=1 Tax=Salipaludibacillus daqingensis TaxID=3041001 RepID=UPI002476A1E2|nr:deoxyribodipyrimidine photo-lyase [Salipaludibacillus daqingensis]
MKPTFAVWLRNDFRLHDQPSIQKALEAASAYDGQVILFFHLHPNFIQEIDLHHDYFFQTLQQFRHQCAKSSLHVHIIYGDNETAFTTLTRQLSELKTVFYGKDYTPFGLKRDQEVSTFLSNKGIDTVPLDGSHLLQPDEVLKEDGTPYKVFTPYYRQWARQTKPSLINTNINELRSQYKNRDSIDLQGENFFETEILAMCRSEWQGLGENTALKRLEQFLDERISHYDESRNLPSIAGTSRLSPYIKTGSLSVQKIFHAVSDQLDTSGKGADTYLKELAWRDFYAMIYYHYPNTKNQEYQEKYRSIRWSSDKQLLEKWKAGKTGFPIVDAGMRQLNEIGWMHNRLRMVTASFLSKDYLIDWRLGEEYFSKKLIDYDEASNVGGWQWAASVGTDAVPYFRVFNPTRQAERFDPDGKFIKKYVPELVDVPESMIHKLSKMTDEMQVKANCQLGKDYPHPTVDHSLQRKKAISLFKGEDDE